MQQFGYGARVDASGEGKCNESSEVSPRSWVSIVVKHHTSTRIYSRSKQVYKDWQKFTKISSSGMTGCSLRGLDP